MNPTELYKNLADDNRLKSILLIAKEGELCVCELMYALNEHSQPKISRHLARLKNSGLLLTRKQKQWVFYAINPELPSWVHQIISLTLNENIAFISANLQALQLMGTRPARLDNCCS